MSGNTLVQAILNSLLIQSPSLLVSMFGLVVAVIFVARYPLPSLLVIGALLLNLLVVIVAPVGQQLLFSTANASHWQPSDIQRASMALNLVFSIVRGGALVLLLTAVFVRRSTEPGFRKGGV